LLNEPNTFSPANVDASVMYRRWKESRGKDKEYENIIRKQVSASRQEAEREGVVVPTTIEEYCIRTKPKPAEDNFLDTDMTDFYDDDFGDDLDDDEELDEDYQDEDNEDSGNGES
jgi:ubiquitin-conjugating enzyme E2 R